MSVMVAIMMALIATANAAPLSPLPNNTMPKEQDWTTKSSNATLLPNNTTTPKEQHWTSNSSTESDEPAKRPCRLTTTDPYIHNKVHHLLTIERASLINYVLNFTKYSHNPLTMTVGGVYDAKHWSRVTTAHGQTLLSLAFNYGVLSMMTLTLGTETLDVELQDSPPNCFASATDQQKVQPLTAAVPVVAKLYPDYERISVSLDLTIRSITRDTEKRQRFSVYL